MFFPSRALLGAKKLSAITSKRGNKNFYKGRGAKSIGYRTPHGQPSNQSHTQHIPHSTYCLPPYLSTFHPPPTIDTIYSSHLTLSPVLSSLLGRFTFDPSKFTRLSFVAPDLTGFELKAYVAPNTPLLGSNGQPVQPNSSKGATAG